MDEVSQDSSSDNEGGTETNQLFNDQQGYREGFFSDDQLLDGTTDEDLVFHHDVSDFEYPPQEKSLVKRLRKSPDDKIIAVFNHDIPLFVKTIQETDNLSQVNTSRINSSSDELSHLIIDASDALKKQKTPFQILKLIRFDTDKGKQEMSAAVTCNIDKVSADELKFMREMDQQFFGRANNSDYKYPTIPIPIIVFCPFDFTTPMPLDVFMGLSFGAFTWAPAFATAAATVYAMGNLVRIPKASVPDWIFLVWNVVSHAPLYGRQFYQGVRDITGCLRGMKPFQSSYEDPFLPHVYQKSKGHYITYGAAGFAAAIHATTSLFFLYLAEKHYLYTFFWPTGPFLWTSEFMRNLSRIKRSVDRQFIRRYDDIVGEDIHGMRQHLLQQNEKFQQALHNDDFVNACYDLMGNENDEDDIQQDGVSFYFKLSLLFLRDPGFFYNFDHKSSVKIEDKNKEKDLEEVLSNSDERKISNNMTLRKRIKTKSKEKEIFDEKVTDNPISQLNAENRTLKRILNKAAKEKEALAEEKENLAMELRRTENSKKIAQGLQPSEMRSFSDTTTSAILYAAFFARLAGLTYMLNAVFNAMSTPPDAMIDVDVILITSFALGLYEVIFKAVVERQTFQDYVPKFFTVGFKKASGAISTINGVISALRGTAASLSAYGGKLSLPFQIVTLAPDFIVNGADHAQFNEEHLEGLVRDVRTTRTANWKKEEMGVGNKRAWLEHYSDKLTPFLETGWDGNTIRLLFQITQRAK